MTKNKDPIKTMSSVTTKKLAIPIEKLEKDIEEMNE